MLLYNMIILTKEDGVATKHETIVLIDEETWDAKLLEKIVNNGGLEYFKNDTLEHLSTYSHYVGYPDIAFDSPNYVAYLYKRLNRLLEKHGTDPQSPWYPYVCVYKELRDTGIFDTENLSLTIPVKGTDPRVPLSRGLQGTLFRRDLTPAP